MGAFTISSKRDADAEALTSTVALADADINRITVAYAGIYFPNGVTEGDAIRPPTGQEVFDAVANGLLQGIIANTINQEKAVAAKDAQDAVTPINVTP